MALLVLAVAVGLVVMYVVRSTTNVPGQAQGTVTGGKPATAQTMDAILNSAQTYIGQGEFEKAEAVLKGGIAEHADEQKLYVLYAEMLAQRSRLPEAYDNYVKALSIGPREAGLEMSAGTIANMIGKVDRAEEHYAAAQTANPSDYKAPLFLAQVQIKRGEVEEAKKNLLLAVKLKPDAAMAWGTLADVYLRENKAELALQTIKKAREAEPRVTLWRLIEARALKRNGDAAGALTLLSGLDATAKREAGVMQLIAECDGMLGKPQDAAEMYAAAADGEAGNGALAMEAALWFERAKLPARGLVYAKRAAALNAEGAAAVVDRLAK